MEGKISSCEECALHYIAYLPSTDIYVNITSDRDQMKLDIVLSTRHGYPRTGMWDSIPFITLRGTGMKLKHASAIIANQ